MQLLYFKGFCTVILIYIAICIAICIANCSVNCIGQRSLMKEVGIVNN